MIKLLFGKTAQSLRALLRKLTPIWRRRIIELVVLILLIFFGVSFITRWSNFEFGKAQFKDGDFIQAQYNFSKEQFPFPLDLWRQYFNKGTALLVANSQEEARAALLQAKDELEGSNNAAAQCMIETNLAISYEKSALALRQQISTLSDESRQAAGYRLIAQTYSNVLLSKTAIQTYCDMSDAAVFKKAADEVENAKNEYQSYLQKAFDIDGTGLDPALNTSSDAVYDPNVTLGLKDPDSRQQQLVTQSEAGTTEFLQAQDEAQEQSGKVYKKW